MKGSIEKNLLRDFFLLKRYFLNFLYDKFYVFVKIAFSQKFYFLKKFSYFIRETTKGFGQFLKIPISSLISITSFKNIKQLPPALAGRLVIFYRDMRT